MNRKPPELPNIEDATLVACLAPLMDAMHASAEPDPIHVPAGGSPRIPPGSNDNPLPVARDRDALGTLDEWRSLAEDDFGVFRMIERFLTLTEVELACVAVEFPRQIGGTAARIARLKHRLATQYDTVTTVLALMERASARAAVAQDQSIETAFPVAWE